MNINRFFVFLASLLCAGSLSAQYPKVPRDVQHHADSIRMMGRFRSDSAWAVARTIVMHEDTMGRPYVYTAYESSDLLKMDIPAFPGAQGGAMYTPGGRGGKVITVTNLNDRGEGSFRWACEQGGARIIVFNVAGIIHLTTPVIIRAPYITIAGQTAPGDGVCVAGESVWIDTHDVVIRHMRFRRGNLDAGIRDDALGGNPIGNIMIDHCSCSWGSDENISFYRYMRGNLKLPTVNVTIQNTISSEGLDTYNHAFGSTIGGKNCTFIGNLWACNISRNPSVGMGDEFNLVNCVIFNWWNRTMDGGDASSRWNIINNYYKPGPMTPVGKPEGYRIARPESRKKEGDRQIWGKVYADGNIMEGYPEITKDNWAGGIQPETDPHHPQLLEIKAEEPLPMPLDMSIIVSAEDAYKNVLNNAGATLPRRDAVDQRIVETVRTGQPTWVEGNYKETMYVKRRLNNDSYKLGIIYDPAQVGGYPEYKGEPYIDTDRDGMPDKWEKKYGLDPFDPSDAVKDCNGDGYTNIEKYINNINPRKKVDWKDPKNNHDTLR